MKKSDKTQGKCWRLLLLMPLLMAGLVVNAQWDPSGDPSNWTDPAVTGNPTYVHVLDPFGGDELDDQFTQGSTDLNFKAWSWSQVKNKNDIANGLAVLIGTRLYFAGDRLAIEGTAQIGFWFFTAGTRPVMDPGAKFGYFDPPRQIGDILVLSDFTGGGKYADVTTYRISGFNNKGDAILSLWQTQAVVAINNDHSVNVPADWQYVSDMYPPNAFYEGYVDLGLGGAGVDICYNGFMLETRSSASLTASLDDLLWGNFSTVPEIEAEGDEACANTNPEVPVELILCATPDDSDLTFKWYSDADLTNYVDEGRCLTVSVTSTTRYWVTATNSAGCVSAAAWADAVVFPNPTARAGEEKILCYGETAEISITITGGTAPYELSYGGEIITSPDGIASLSLGAGSTDVTIIDNNGCIYELNIDPEEPDELTASAAGGEINCYGGVTDVTITAEGGTPPYFLYNDAGTIKIGDFEDDGTFVVEDQVAGKHYWRVFDVNECDAPVDIELVEPELVPIELTCSSPTVGPCISEADLDTAFNSWKSSLGEYTGGTPPVTITYKIGDQIVNLEDITVPDICGGSITVDVEIVDDCEETDTRSCTFTVLDPEVIEYNFPTSTTAGDCLSQVDVDQAFADWLAEATVSGGCDPLLTDGDPVAPDACGGSVTVNFRITDYCLDDPITGSATFTVPDAPIIEAYCSNEIEVPVCATEEEIDVLFEAWKAGFGYDGGCNPQDNMDELEALDWRDFADIYSGGTVSFTLIVWDDCHAYDEAYCEFVIPQCVINCETAYGRLEDADGASLGRCFTNDGFGNWGWTNQIEEDGVYIMPLYAGAAHCDPSRGWGQIGTVTISYDGEELEVLYEIMAGYSMSEVHVYVGCGKYPVMRNGRETIAPGQYTHNASVDRATSYTVTFTDVKGPVWVIAHAVVCDVSGTLFVTGKDYTKEIDCMPKGGESMSVIQARTPGQRGPKVDVFPNPFRNETKISFSVDEDSRTVVEVFTIQGARVAVLFDETVMAEDTHTVSFTPDVYTSRQIYLVVVRNERGMTTRQIITY